MAIAIKGASGAPAEKRVNAWPLFSPAHSLRCDFDNLSVFDRRYGEEQWKPKLANWWGNTTITEPTPAMVEPAKEALRLVGNWANGVLNHERPLACLHYINSMLLQESERCRDIIRQTLAAPNAEVILETNGTSAIAMVRHMQKLAEGDKILSFCGADTGQVVIPAMRGENPWAEKYAKVMFRQNTGMWTKQDDVEATGPFAKVVMPKTMNSDGLKRDDELLAELENELRDEDIRLVLVPHVSKLGQLLPVRQIGELVKSANASKPDNKRITYVVDGVQAFGRVGAGELRDPLAYCDYYIILSSKALGALMSTSAVITSAERLEHDQWNLANSWWMHYVRHYQFPAGYAAIEAHLRASKPELAMSPPELVSFRCALEQHWQRGEGAEFSERRNGILAGIKAKRKELVELLRDVGGLRILESGEGVRMVDAMVSFAVPGKPPSEIKEKLQSGELGEIVTLGNPTAGYLRAGIPEYREPPDPRVLAEALKRAVR